MKDYAGTLGVPLARHCIKYLPDKAAGYLESYRPAVGVSAMVTDVLLADDFHFVREKSDREFYILRFEKVTTPGSLRVKMNGRVSSHAERMRYSVYLTSSLQSFQYIARKGLHIQAIFISLQKEWIYKNIYRQEVEILLNKYLALETASVNFEVFGSDYFPHFHTIFDQDPSGGTRRKTVASRINLLIETFFLRLLRKLNQLQNATGYALSQKDLSIVIDVAAKVVKDVTMEPPGIEQLAKTAGMSASKLKVAFKKVFGSGIYAFYQENRMNLARLLLTSGTYSVKEVGKLIGYQNLSHFSTAFKKQFHYFPSELARF
jgi:AraC-like DNA-binding protein